MWWSRALVCLIVLALGPVGCGFQPIYARSDGAVSSPVAEQLASVRVAGIDDRIGQQLRNNLVLALSPRGEPASPRYLLEVRLTETSQSMAASKDGNSTVGRSVIIAQYVLIDTHTGKTVHGNRTRTFTSFRYLGPRYASTASERDAQTSALSEIAEEIRAALAAYFANPGAFARNAAPAPVQQQPSEEWDSE